MNWVPRILGSRLKLIHWFSKKCLFTTANAPIWKARTTKHELTRLQPVFTGCLLEPALLLPTQDFQLQWICRWFYRIIEKVSFESWIFTVLGLRCFREPSLRHKHNCCLGLHRQQDTSTFSQKLAAYPTVWEEWLGSLSPETSNMAQCAQQPGLECTVNRTAMCTGATPLILRARGTSKDWPENELSQSWSAGALRQTETKSFQRDVRSLHRRWGEGELWRTRRQSIP